MYVCYVHIYIYLRHVYTCRDPRNRACTHVCRHNIYAILRTIFYPHSSCCEGCNAESVGTFSFTLVNCQKFGIVSVTDSAFENQGTVCGTVTKVTADNICGALDYGTAVDYGTADQKG